MQNRKTLGTKSGFSLVQVDELDENGNIVSASYEVVDPDGDVIGRFGSLKEAQDFLKTVLPQEPEPPRPSGPRM
ncbi:hypothetical protein [Aeromonas salmonicida]|uniref:hypothetical protein n=1 Tax=Aeromonas salmonicida TaxID=645 RepID=UPI00232F28E6|nr:hypothetical protein [Aeromonas salmonicida]WCH21107.1 hypothetical protein ONZ54_13195 [Aeromonas salmonicida]